MIPTAITSEQALMNLLNLADEAVKRGFFADIQSVIVIAMSIEQLRNEPIVHE